MVGGVKPRKGRRMIRKTTLLLSGALLGALGAVALTQPQFFTGGAANAAASDTYRQLNLFGDVFERILTNDKIVALDGTDITGLTLDQAVDKMRGGINTPITLTIVRSGVDKPFDVKLVRAEIKVQAVRSEAKNDIGYIRITSFSEQTF